MHQEQQRFAKAIRSMQLAGTLFGGMWCRGRVSRIHILVAVIHIKPQMEKLLRLVPDTLLKEIQYVLR